MPLTTSDAPANEGEPHLVLVAFRIPGTTMAVTTGVLASLSLEPNMQKYPTHVRAIPVSALSVDDRAQVASLLTDDDPESFHVLD